MWQECCVSHSSATTRKLMRNLACQLPMLFFAHLLESIRVDSLATLSDYGWQGYVVSTSQTSHLGMGTMSGFTLLVFQPTRRVWCTNGTFKHQSLSSISWFCVMPSTWQTLSMLPSGQSHYAHFLDATI